MENKRRSFEENYAELIKFCKRENRLPQSKFGKEEGRLRNFIQKYKDNFNVQKIIKTYKQYSTNNISLQDLIEFCERENRLPNPFQGKKESDLYKFIKKHDSNTEIIEIVKKYKKYNVFEDNLLELLEFCEKEGRLPNSYSDGKLGNKLSTFCYRNKFNSKIVEIKKKYGKGGA